MASGTTTSAMFCRHCGYNLYGLPQNQCPECGRAFDPNNSETYSKHSGSPSRRRWAIRVVVSLVALLLLADVGGLSLWWPWHREQAAVRMVALRLGKVSTKTVGPQWLQNLLGQQYGYLLERVDGVDLGRSSSSSTTDADLASLDGLSELRTLSLGGTEVSDAGLEHLKNLKGLQALNLVHTKVADAGLENLKDLKGLRSLILRNTNVTNAGLEYLKDLKALQTVDVRRTQVGGEAIAALQQALPGCTIYYPPTYYPSTNDPSNTDPLTYYPSTYDPPVYDPSTPPPSPPPRTSGYGGRGRRRPRVDGHQYPAAQ